MALITFANQPTTTVSGGGTTAPASGTPEQWTVASSASFPNASLTTSPPQLFHVADTAATSEIVAVTAVTSNVWGVTRGAESTTPVAHTSGFTVMQVVTAGGLQSFQQTTQMGNTASSTITTTGTIATYTPPATDIAAAGVVYDFACFGTIHNTTNTMTVTTTWGASTVLSVISSSAGILGTNMPAGSPWWLEGKVHCYGATTMVCAFNFQSANSSATHTISTMVGANSSGVTVGAATGPLNIVVGSAAWTLITTGALIHRIS